MVEEKIKEKERYKKQNGIFFSVLGLVFLLIPISIYTFYKLEIKYVYLLLWTVILSIVIIVYSIQLQKSVK